MTAYNWGKYRNTFGAFAVAAAFSLSSAVAAPIVSRSSTSQPPLEETVIVEGKAIADDVQVYPVARQFRVIDEQGKVLPDINTAYVHLYGKNNEKLDKERLDVKITKNDRPIALTVTLDVSSSMKLYVPLLQEFVGTVYDALQPTDYFRVIRFSGKGMTEGTPFVTVSGHELINFQHYYRDEKLNKRQRKAYRELSEDQQIAQLIAFCKQLQQEPQQLQAAHEWGLRDFLMRNVPRTDHQTYPDDALEAAMKGFIGFDTANKGHIFVSDGEFTEQSFPMDGYLRALFIQDFVGKVGNTVSNGLNRSNGDIGFLLQEDNVRQIAEDTIAQLRSVYDLRFNTTDQTLEKCRGLNIRYVPPDGHSYTVFYPKCNLPPLNAIIDVLRVLPDTPANKSYRNYFRRQLAKHGLSAAQIEAEIAKAK